VRLEIEAGFERMLTFADVPSVFAVGRTHFILPSEIEAGFERMLTLADVPSVFAVGRTHFIFRFNSL